MKNVVLFAGAALAVSASAQAPFTIVSPKQGAKVRETVPIVMPKASVPQGGFIGVSIDGKFIEATTPTADPKTGNFIYNLNTKGKQIPDGDHTLGVTLFMNSGGQPVIADKSEVKIHVGNREGIDFPADGMLIKYKFFPGYNSIYRVDIGQDASILSEAKNKMGGRASQLPGFAESARMLVAVDDVKPGGLGLVRFQLVPYKGKDKDYVVATVAGDPGPSKIPQNQFAPMYRILKPSGHEVYGDVPEALVVHEDDVERYVLVTLPLPLLPQDKVKIGDTWQGGIAFDTGLEARVTGKASRVQPAVGTLTNVEWESGQPCAKIVYSIQESSKDAGQMNVAGRQFQSGFRSAITQTIWFSLKEGRIIRSEIIAEGDTKINAPESGGGGGGGFMPGGGGDNQGPGARGPRPAGGGGGNSGVGVVLPAGGQGAMRAGIRGQGSNPQGGGQNQGGGQGGGGSYFVRQKLFIRLILER